MGRRFGREGTWVYLWLILIDVWQKATKFCKAIILWSKNKLKIKLMTWKKWQRRWIIIICVGPKCEEAEFFKPFYVSVNYKAFWKGILKIFNEIKYVSYDQWSHFLVCMSEIFLYRSLRKHIQGLGLLWQRIWNNVIFNIRWMDGENCEWCKLQNTLEQRALK